MRQRFPSRQMVLAWALLLGFVLLAAALNGFELADGLRIESTVGEFVEETFAARERNAPNPYDGRLLGWVVSIVVSLSIVLFFAGLIRREHRTSTLSLVVAGAMVIFVVSRIPPPVEEYETPSDRGSMTSGSDDEAIGVGELLAREDAVDVAIARSQGPRVWSWILAGIATVGLLLVARPRLTVRKRREPTEDESFGESARAAIGEAEAGGDVLETVVRCYREMLRIYHDTRYSGRRTTLTPRELTEKLVAAGVPRDSVERLTALFERVRYGTIRLSPDEERSAVDHLRMIAAALGNRND